VVVKSLGGRSTRGLAAVEWVTVECGTRVHSAEEFERVDLWTAPVPSYDTQYARSYRCLSWHAKLRLRSEVEGECSLSHVRLCSPLRRTACTRRSHNVRRKTPRIRITHANHCMYWKKRLQMRFQRRAIIRAHKCGGAGSRARKFQVTTLLACIWSSVWITESMYKFHEAVIEQSSQKRIYMLPNSYMRDALHHLYL
jgi:hypothetical protein